MNKAKAELEKLINEICELKDKCQKLEEQRRKATSKLDSELSTAYTRLDSLYEKKRLAENEYLMSLNAE